MSRLAKMPVEWKLEGLAFYLKSIQLESFSKLFKKDLSSLTLMTKPIIEQPLIKQYTADGQYKLQTWLLLLESFIYISVSKKPLNIRYVCLKKIASTTPYLLNPSLTFHSVLYFGCNNWRNNQYFASQFWPFRHKKKSITLEGFQKKTANYPLLSILIIFF